ncbi:N-acetylglucosamine-6-phosphate deacetylase [Candidatus Poriferisocius sp.]|uniref:N-acetylglucosamine-6-phosphate deacetylase n=1 Tax=Candidatus Poriferisocius sp. TaxID=3101276 RepID=UPI003B5AD0C0
MTRLGVDTALVAGELVPGDVEVDDGRVVAVGVGGGDGSGRIAVSGFVDLQVNGFAGVDFATASPSDVGEVTRALVRTGVTGFLPTLITGALDHTIAQANAITGAPADEWGAQVGGVHLEGPAINPARAGAHCRDHVVSAGAGLARRLLEEVADLRLVTMAPELDGAIDMIRVLRDGGVAVSFGHTEATEAEAEAGFEAGGVAVTHIFNAMAQMGHRDPGIAAAALMRGDVHVGVIADGLHVAPTMVKMVAALAGPRLVLVTDACAGAACADGDYTLGAEVVNVRAGVARRPDGVLAGSTLTMPDAIGNLIDLGIGFADAVGAATSATWALLGQPERGSLGPGAVADVVVTDDDLVIHQTLIAGRKVYER